MSDKANLIADMRTLLSTLEWSGTAHGAYGEQAQRCPICECMPRGVALAAGGGLYTKGTGHNDDCELARVLSESA